MVTIVQKGDLSSDFTNDNTNNAGKVDIYANDGTTLLGYLLPV